MTAARTLYRPACPSCGWHGARITDEAIAQARSARHMLNREHSGGFPVVESAPGPNPSPWVWAR